MFYKRLIFLHIHTNAVLSTGNSHAIECWTFVKHFFCPVLPVIRDDMDSARAWAQNWLWFDFYSSLQAQAGSKFYFIFHKLRKKERKICYI